MRLFNRLLLEVVWFLVILAAILVLTGRAKAQSFTVFAYQHSDSSPHQAHSWANFTDEKGVVTTISWMTTSERVHVLAPAGSGTNWTHISTLAYAKKVGSKVYSFGPYPCSKELVERARAQKAKLESGAVKFKAVALVGFGPHRANCVAAVAGVSDHGFCAGTKFGRRASLYVAKLLLESK